MLLSKEDIKREVIIPKSLNEDLAELIGAIMGDGNIRMGNGRYELHITGDLKEDREYHKKHLLNLFKRLFKIKPKITEKNNFRVLTIRSKAIVSFMINNLKLSNGKKTPFVPNYIMNSRDQIKKKFLRGLADTDFYLKFKTRYKNKNYYPIIIGHFNNKKFVRELKLLLETIDFHSHLENRKKYDKIRKKLYTSYTVNIVGKKNLKKWMENKMFSNQRHLIRYRVWTKLGFCPPYTNIAKGKAILKN